jgi:acyl-CoA thioesterase
MADALFTPLGHERFAAQAFARGPWSPDALHGGPVAALLGGAAEALLGDLFPSRVTVELLRPVPLTPLQRSAEVLRPGKKVQLVRTQLATEDGTVVATATALGIRRADVTVPEMPEALVPPPAPPEALVADPMDERLATEGVAFHNAGVEHRFAAGHFMEPGPAVDWIKLCVPVIEGAAPSPLQRVLAAADFGNGISRLVDFTKLLFINPDLTVHLHRLPAGEWVCLDAASRLEPHGVGLSQSALWDVEGPLGRALQSLIVEDR